MKYDLNSMSMTQLVDLYNAKADVLGEKQVKRFSDRKTAVRRVEAIVDRKPEKAQPQPRSNPEVPDEVEQEAAGEFPIGEMAEAAKVEPKKSRMRFVFPLHDPKAIKDIKGKTSLRAQARELLLGGATFAQVEQLVERFDKERGKDSENVERRAYELVRIMHYYLGYGVSHDQETGEIKIYCTPLGKK